jgi:hypothetical protein
MTMARWAGTDVHLGAFQAVVWATESALGQAILLSFSVHRGAICHLRCIQPQGEAP